MEVESDEEDRLIHVKSKRVVIDLTDCDTSPKKRAVEHAKEPVKNKRTRFNALHEAATVMLAAEKHTTQ
jgi:hypothetical protein